MAFRQPWDVACPRCKAKKGNVCRTPYSCNSLEGRAHSDRWSRSLGLRNPIAPGHPSTTGRRP